MMKKAYSIAGILLLAAGMALGAQETPSLEDIPGFRERAVSVRIVSRVIEQNQTVVWHSENVKVTLPGRPVGIQLVGSNIIVAVQFTPFLRPDGQHLLAAHGQIWITLPEGISFHTTMQTIPLRFHETVYFFPLGSMIGEDEENIEIQLTLEPFMEGASTANSPP